MTQIIYGTIKVKDNLDRGKYKFIKNIIAIIKTKMLINAKNIK